jgi:hypothetical protein
MMGTMGPDAESVFFGRMGELDHSITRVSAYVVAQWLASLVCLMQTGRNGFRTQTLAVASIAVASCVFTVEIIQIFGVFRPLMSWMTQRKKYSSRAAKGFGTRSVRVPLLLAGLLRSIFEICVRLQGETECMLACTISGWMSCRVTCL